VPFILEAWLLGQRRRIAAQGFSRQDASSDVVYSIAPANQAPKAINKKNDEQKSLPSDGMSQRCAKSGSHATEVQCNHSAGE
jgi:hypothetical protein